MNSQSAHCPAGADPPESPREGANPGLLPAASPGLGHALSKERTTRLARLMARFSSGAEPSQALAALVAALLLSACELVAQQPIARIPVRALDAGGRGVCGIDPTGAVHCWTWAGDVEPRHALKRLGHGVPARTISAGLDHACALAEDGEAYCWGQGRHGQLGTGSTADTDVPAPVRSPERFRQISAGGTHTCAVGVSGALYCWGGNWHGQIGTGGATGAREPVRIDTGTTYTAVSAGGIHACGVTPSGVRCWADQRSGRLGMGRVMGAEVMTPLPIAGTDALTDVAAGHWHTCGLLAGGDVTCWGGGGEGVPGDTVGVPRWLPTHGVSQVTAGPRHACAVARGEVWFWGGHASGEAGVSGSRFLASLVCVALPYRAQRIAAGGDDFAAFTCALDDRGVVHCWGSRTWTSAGTASPSD